MNKSVDFVHLHCHSEFSTLDGMPKVEEYVIKCGELGFPALALTEHGNMRSIYQLQIKTTQGFDYKGKRYDYTNQVKPIFGIEFYASFLNHRLKGLPDSEKQNIRRDCANETEYKKRLREQEYALGFRKRFHILAFAKNEQGLQNLYKLNYLAWRDGYYYRPRIDTNLLFKYHEGLCITTACIGGYSPDMILAGNEAEADKWIRNAKKVFGDDLYVEIQPHNLKGDKGTPLEGKMIQEIANRSMIGLADRYKIKVIATNDCHYLTKEDYESHNVLLAINGRQSVKSEDAWRFGDSEFYMKTKDEMIKTFMTNHPYIGLPMIRTSLENTMEIIEKCNTKLDIDRKKGILPVVDTKGYDEDEYLKRLAINGWKNFRNMPKLVTEYAYSQHISEQASYKIYRDRLYFELQRIKDLKFAKYFLIIHELINWARSKDIMVGPGRGSASAALTCYLLGITSIDPIKYNLYFERFLAPGRIDYPDIDMDFEDTRRQEIFQHLYEKYGEENVCQIGTIGRMKGKLALKDVGKALDVPSSETNKITKHIIERSSGDARASQSVEDSFKEFDVCKEYNAKYPDVLKHVIRLEGKARQVGVHAAGIQMADRDISTIVPIEYRDTKFEDGTSKRIKVAGLDWLECQGLGLVKLDVLGLKTLSILKTAQKTIKERRGLLIDFESLPLDDPKVLDKYTAGSFVGIFQFDSIGMTKTCEKLTFKSFEDVIALNALYRPGSMRSGLATHYINRAIGKEQVKTIHPVYDKICKETYGILVYQEQLIKCFSEIAGYQEATADELRKKIAKSAGVETLGKESDKFIDGAVKNGMNREQAQQLFENMAFFGSYAFNKAHAAAYGVISYWEMYLKTYYPVEFYHSLMRHEKDQNEILRFVVDARKNGLEVKTPDINKSNVQFSIIDDETIISGLVDIKGCGGKASNDIASKQPFTSLHDFMDKVNRRVVNKGVIKSLVMAGAFRSLYPSIGAMLNDEVRVKSKKSGEENRMTKQVWEWMMDMKPDAAEDLYKSHDTEENQLDEESEVKVLSQVCPIPPYKHKIEYYTDIDRYILNDRSDLTSYISPVELYDNELEFGDEGQRRARGWFKGTLVDIKYNNVGDFHKEVPDEKEKKRIGWGKRYANINIENTIGIKRVNIDIDVFPSFRSIIDKGLQTPVMIAGNVIKWSEVIYADVMVDLDEFKDKIHQFGSIKEAYKNMNPFQRYFLQHPVTVLPKQSIPPGISKLSPIRSDNRTDRKGKYITKTVIVLLTRVKWHWTKKNKKMAFVEIEDNSGYLSVILWPEGVAKYSSIFKAGNVLQMTIRKDTTDKYNQYKESGYFILDERKISLVKTYWQLEQHIQGETSNKDIMDRVKTGQIKTDPSKYIG